MIKLEKLEEPQRLKDNSGAWTQALLVKKLAGQEPTATEKTRYRHPDIKDVLVKETNGKCAYCESRLRHIHHGDVEHIYPKSLDASKTFKWDNLTLSCEVCNQNKSDNDPTFTHIIDPYTKEPSDHLIFVGGLIFSKGTVEGTSTRAILDLHRAALVEMRNDQVERIMAIYAQVLDTNLPIAVRRALYKDMVAREGSAQAPYTAMARCIIKDMEKALAPEILAA